MGKGKKGGKGKGKGRGRGDEEAKGPAGSSTDLHLAARNGETEKIAELLAASPEHLNQADQHRRSPLHMAAFFGKAEAVAKLLEKAADPQLQAMDGFLPLHFAAQAGHLEVLKLLVRHVGAKGEYGAVKKHVNAVVTKGKKSALHLALSKGHAECARFLVMKGSSCEAKTSQGQTALDLCSSQELREELMGKAKVAAVEAKEEESKAAMEPAKSEAEPPAKKQKVEGEAVKLLPADAIDGLPAAAVSVSSLKDPPAGLLASGPWHFETLELVDDGEKAYPAGIPAMADVEWDLKIKEEPEEDGPVWCWTPDVATKAGKVQMKMKKSSKRLLYYTHFSDEALMLDKDSKCNACGLMLETIDGHLLLQRTNERWHFPCTAVSSLQLVELVAEALKPHCAFSLEKVLGSTRLLGLLEANDAPQGCRHHLVAASRLPIKVEEAAKASQEAGFLHFRQDCPKFSSAITLEDFAKEKPQDVQSQAVALLQALLAA